MDVHVLRLIDVADSIDLARLAEVLRALEPTRGAAVLRGPERGTSAGVVLRNEPLDLRIGPRMVGPFSTNVRLRVFDFGVVGMRFTFSSPAQSDNAIIDVASSATAQSATFDSESRAIWKELSAQAGDAVSPWEENPTELLVEDYTVFVFDEPPPLADPDTTFAHVLLGELPSRRLARSLVQEISRRAIRYYEEDLVLVDYDTAIVIDESGGGDLVDIFEIASAQLLEYRYYDALLARALRDLASDVKRARSAVALIRSPYAVASRRAASLALEITEMSDRLEQATTLRGDTYTVQVYREAAVRFRLPEAGSAVREKIGMIARVAEVIGGQVRAHRDVALELLIIVLIAIEIVIAIGGPVHL